MRKSESPQPAARSPQPAARSPQPAARSPQPADISQQNETMREILEHWDDETKRIRAALLQMSPKPSEADIDDCLMAMAEKLLDEPPKFQSVLHARRWMRLVCKNLFRDIRRYGKKFQELEEAEKIETVEDWLIQFEDEDLERAALAMLGEEDTELLRLRISGLSITDIAELNGMNRTTMQKRMKHIHVFLKENL